MLRYLVLCCVVLSGLLCGFVWSSLSCLDLCRAALHFVGFVLFALTLAFLLVFLCQSLLLLPSKIEREQGGRDRERGGGRERETFLY